MKDHGLIKMIYNSLHLFSSNVKDNGLIHFFGPQIAYNSLLKRFEFSGGNFP